MHRSRRAEPERPAVPPTWTDADRAWLTRAVAIAEYRQSTAHIPATPRRTALRLVPDCGTEIDKARAERPRYVALRSVRSVT